MNDRLRQIGFQKRGQSGQTISDYLPRHSRIADDIAIVRSLRTSQINHDPAHTVMNTGTSISDSSLPSRLGSPRRSG